MRYLSPFVERDLKKKLIYLSGPRQVGKSNLVAPGTVVGKKGNKAVLAATAGQVR